ncbi:MAG: hypothetical protein SGJ21_04685 [Alphaproteobacteria bacterium]|nr:hypothetical protein [Alphaproteobacteria bacterium]
MSGHEPKIPIACQHRQAVADAQLRKQGIDGPDLDTSAAATIAQFGSFDMIGTIRNQKWQIVESFQQLISRLGSEEPLQNFLKYESSRYDCFTAGKSATEFGHLRHWLRLVAAQRQRPHAGVDKQCQPRSRSAL